MSKIQWPYVLDLSPVEDLDNFIPDFIIDRYEKKGIREHKIRLPINISAYLGKCETKDYFWCPSIPDHYIEYGYNFGVYYWFDFQIEIASKSKKYRMAINEGSSDCNDGLWGTVWDSSGRYEVAYVRSVGDSETVVESVSPEHNKMYQLYRGWFPGCEESEQEDLQNKRNGIYREDSYPYERFYYFDVDSKNGHCFERLITLAIKLAFDMKRYRYNESFSLVLDCNN